MDGKIAWEGSLKILSHNDTQEQMHRIEGQNAIQQIISNLEFDKDEAPETLAGSTAPPAWKRELKAGWWQERAASVLFGLHPFPGMPPHRKYPKGLFRGKQGVLGTHNKMNTVLDMLWKLPTKGGIPCPLPKAIDPL